ncbi:hypothetical protein ACLESD_07040 [Pyxidicoccus sp. 3LFB2]
MRRVLFGLVMALSAGSASATSYEDWYSPQVSIAGEINNDGHAYVWNASQRWLLNNWKPDCRADMPGPNRCYAPGGGRLNFHAERGGEFIGHGFSLISHPVSFTNGLSIEVPVTAWCTQARNAEATKCGVNIGIWESEWNYRSIGVKSHPSCGTCLYLNLWGPTGEANFNGLAPLGNAIPTPAGATYVFKVQYWNSPSGWRWDYFMNGAWVAGHPAAPDNQFGMGVGHFPNRQARLQLSAFSYNDRPNVDPWTNVNEPYNAAEGWFGSVSYSAY